MGMKRKNNNGGGSSNGGGSGSNGGGLGSSGNSGGSGSSGDGGGGNRKYKQKRHVGGDSGSSRRDLHDELSMESNDDESQAMLGPMMNN